MTFTLQTTNTALEIHLKKLTSYSKFLAFCYNYIFVGTINIQDYYMETGTCKDLQSLHFLKLID